MQNHDNGADQIVAMRQVARHWACAWERRGNRLELKAGFNNGSLQGRELMALYSHRYLFEVTLIRLFLRKIYFLSLNSGFVIFDQWSEYVRNPITCVIRKPFYNLTLKTSLHLFCLKPYDDHNKFILCHAKIDFVTNF